MNKNKSTTVWWVVIIIIIILIAGYFAYSNNSAQRAYPTPENPIGTTTAPY